MTGTGRAKHPGGPASKAKDMDTVRAEALLAASTAIGGVDRRMIQARRTAIGQGGRDRRRLGGHARNRNAGQVSVALDFEPKLGTAKPENLPNSDGVFLNPLSVDVSAVGGTQVADNRGVVGQDDFAMETRYGRVVDAKIVGWVSSQGVETGFKPKSSWMSKAR